MDELKQQFYEVMHKYQKPFSEEGVTANLTQWNEPKQGLLQLLRRHPLWNEKELAIVFRVEERREIDRITVDETRAAILELGRRACTDDTVYENFETALRAATADYARIPNEYRLDTIRQYGGIKCAPGQKASRIINRLCMKFHLDQIEEEAEAGDYSMQEESTSTAISSGGNTDESVSGMVNINTADAAALKTLTGIGEAKAQAILSYREEHGAFSTVEEIMQVPGIKESTFSAIKDKIAVK